MAGSPSFTKADIRLKTHWAEPHSPGSEDRQGEVRSKEQPLTWIVVAGDDRSLPA